MTLCSSENLALDDLVAAADPDPRSRAGGKPQPGASRPAGPPPPPARPGRDPRRPAPPDDPPPNDEAHEKAQPVTPQPPTAPRQAARPGRGAGRADANPPGRPWRPGWPGAGRPGAGRRRAGRTASPPGGGHVFRRGSGLAAVAATRRRVSRTILAWTASGPETRSGVRARRVALALTLTPRGPPPTGSAAGGRPVSASSPRRRQPLRSRAHRLSRASCRSVHHGGTAWRRPSSAKPCHGHPRQTTAAGRVAPARRHAGRPGRPNSA